MNPPDNAAVSPSRPRFWLGALAVTLGFVALRFLVTPLRMKVVTTLLAPEDYGAVTLLSMTVHGLGLIGSLGVFEWLLRHLPALSEDARHTAFRKACLLMLMGGGGVALVGAGLWNHWPVLAGLSTRISLAAALALFTLFLLIQLRIHFFLGCREHVRARTLQLLWSDLWFLPMLALVAAVAWNAERAVWVWAAWLSAALLMTWRRKAPTTGMAVQSERPLDMPLGNIFRQSMPILPVLVGDWVFRLTGHYALLIHRDAATMAYYALALNVALTGQVAGVPLIDLCGVELGRALGLRSGSRMERPPDAACRIVAQGVRHALAVALPVWLALTFLPNDLIAFLTGPTFRDAALLLPWAGPLPLLMLFNLLLARLLMLMGRPKAVAFGSLLGAAAAIVLCAMVVPKWGAEGALLAIAASAALIDLLYIVEIRAWRWFRASFSRGLALLAGTLGQVAVFVLVRQLPGCAAGRLAVAGGLSVLMLFLAKWVRKTDFHAGSEERI